MEPYLAVMSVSMVALAAAGSYLMYQLLLQNGRVLLRLEALEQALGLSADPSTDSLWAGLPAGTVVHDFALPTLGGDTMRLSQWRGRRVLLVFVSPACSFCRDLLAILADRTESLPEAAPRVIFLTTGDAEENARLFEEHRIQAPVLLEKEAEVRELYRVPGTPAGYLLDETGSTAGKLLVGTETLLSVLESGSTGATAQLPPAGDRKRKFTESLAASRLTRDGLKAGTRAPDFSLKGLDGSKRSLHDFLGQKLLLVFSDPDCGPCRDLAGKLEEIHRWEGPPAVLVISRGDAAANRQKAAEWELTYPIVLQKQWEVSRAYGMFATPIGYLIDEAGVLLSDVAVGGEAILELTAGPKPPGGRAKGSPTEAFRVQ